MNQLALFPRVKAKCATLGLIIPPGFGVDVLHRLIDSHNRVERAGQPDFDGYFAGGFVNGQEAVDCQRLPVDICADTADRKQD